MTLANKKLEYHKKCFEDTISYLQTELDYSKKNIQKVLIDKADIMSQIDQQPFRNSLQPKASGHMSKTGKTMANTMFGSVKSNRIMCFEE